MVRRAATGQLVTDAGQPVTTDTSGPPRGQHAGITVRTEDDMAKAEQDGIYRIGRTQVKVHAGDVIPAGAVPVEERKQPAPANRKLDRAPENRSKRGKQDKEDDT